MGSSGEDPCRHLVTYPPLECSRGELYPLRIVLGHFLCMFTDEKEFHLEDVQSKTKFCFIKIFHLKLIL